MGCSTRNAKVVAISLGSLQRLIGIKAVPGSMIPAIVSIMGDSLSQGVDIQLKVLQTLLSLLTNYPDVHDELLGDVSKSGTFSLAKLKYDFLGPSSLLSVTRLPDRCCFLDRGRNPSSAGYVCLRQGCRS